MRRRPAAAVPAAVGAFALGFMAITGLQEAPRAWAYWTDSGTVTSGPVTAWALTGVSCPSPTFGQPHTLRWATVAGTTYTASVALGPGSPAPGGIFPINSFWETGGTRIQPGQPLTTTTGNQATWGIGSNNPAESTNFFGTWQLVATAPTVAGASTWSATRTGSWQINYAAPRLAVCTVNP